MGTKVYEKSRVCGNEWRKGMEDMDCCVRSEVYVQKILLGSEKGKVNLTFILITHLPYCPAKC